MVANEKTEKRKRKSATCDGRNLVGRAVMFREDVKEEERRSYGFC
jgi:hypothetical protein